MNPMASTYTGGTGPMFGSGLEPGLGYQNQGAGFEPGFVGGGFPGVGSSAPGSFPPGPGSAAYGFTDSFGPPPEPGSHAVYGFTGGSGHGPSPALGFESRPEQQTWMGAAGHGPPHGHGPWMDGSGHGAPHGHGPPHANESEEDLAKRLKRQAKTRELDEQVASCLDQLRRMLRQGVKEGFAPGQGYEGTTQIQGNFSKFKLGSSSIAVDSLQGHLQSAFQRMQTTVSDRMRSETEEYYREAVTERRKVEQAQHEIKEEIERGREREVTLIKECELLNQKTKALQEQDQEAAAEAKHLLLALKNAESQRSTAMNQRLKKEQQATSKIQAVLHTQESEQNENQAKIAELRAELERTEKLESVEVEECRQRYEEQDREEVAPEEQVCARLHLETTSVQHEEECAANDAASVKRLVQDLLVERWDEMKLRMPPHCVIPTNPSRKGLKYLERHERVWQVTSIRQLRCAKIETEAALRNICDNELPKIASELREAYEKNEAIKEDLGRHAEMLGEQAAQNGALGVEFDEAKAEQEMAVSVYEEQKRSCAVKQMQQMVRGALSTGRKTKEANKLWAETHKLQEQMKASNARAKKMEDLADSGQNKLQVLDEQIATLEAESQAAQSLTGNFIEREELMVELQQTQAYMDRMSSRLQMGDSSEYQLAQSAPAYLVPVRQ